MAQLVFRLLTKPEMCSLNPVVDNFYLLSTVVKNRKQGFERLAQLKNVDINLLKNKNNIVYAHLDILGQKCHVMRKHKIDVKLYTFEVVP